MFDQQKHEYHQRANSQDIPTRLSPKLAKQIVPSPGYCIELLMPKGLRLYIELHDISIVMQNQVQNKCKTLLSSTSCTGTEPIELVPKAPPDTSNIFGELIGMTLSHEPNESPAFPSNEYPEVMDRLIPPVSPFSVDDLSFVDQIKEE